MQLNARDRGAGQGPSLRPVSESKYPLVQWSSFEVRGFALFQGSMDGLSVHVQPLAERTNSEFGATRAFDIAAMRQQRPIGH